VTVIVAIDAMGGDHGLSVTLPASLKALKKHPDLALLLVGDRPAIEKSVVAWPVSFQQRAQIVHAEQVVDMDELPSKALRNKRQSSMRLAINAVKESQAGAAVSAGNTGALMAISKFVLKTLPGIDRPAICTMIPTMKGHVHMLDLGANIDSEAHHLVQFAVMGAALAEAFDGNSTPSVALLNIGEEEIKGIQRIKDAHVMIKQTPLNYIGYAEGDDIYKGKADVIVCDGFEGNIALKSSEGVAKLIVHELKAAFKKNLFTRFLALLALPVLKAFGAKMDPGRYNGASLVGLKGIVVKSHGGAQEDSFSNAISVAYHECAKNIPAVIQKRIETWLPQGGLQ
jgi:glycerol-3-phosphate acyltransferase PlsX